MAAERNSQNITCPFCSREFQLTEIFTAQIEKELLAKYEQKYEKQLEEEKQKLREQAIIRAKKEFDAELREKEADIAEVNKKLELYREKEKQLLLKERSFEESKHEMEVAFQKNLTDEVRKAYAKAQENANEQYDLKLKEKEKIIEDLNKQMKEGQRKAEQGSMKLQGEILELEMEELLQNYFPNDEIIPVAPGKKGGDIIQRVKLVSGKTAGTILWETKRTKNWQSAWIQKLKEDQRELKAEMAVIASEVLPAEIKNFGIENGVWITDIKFALGLSTVLRENLKNAAAIRNANEGKDEKAEMIFGYLTGSQFKQRVESILEAYVEMQGDMEAEKRYMERAWAKKEKQIERFIKNISGMYGDLQGIGANVPEIKLLEMQ